MARRASERIPPRAELMEQAAEASRAGLRTRRERIIATARPILQTSVAASCAWLAATELVGHQQPFFAPISAVITLGLTVGQRRRRAVELAIGVAVGITIADLLVAGIGTGTLQLGVVTGLAMLAATLVGGGPLLASQAAASAVLVATLQPPSGFDFDRALDALVGSGTALAVSALLLPIDPVRLVRERLGPLLEGLSAALDRIAVALEQRDEREAERALTAVSPLDPLYESLTATLAAAGDAARISLTRRGKLSQLERYIAAIAELGLAIENVRVLARGAVRAMALDDLTPPEVTAAIRELAIAARELGPLLEDEGADASREAALRAVRLANAVLEETANLSAVHIVGQVRLVAVDLLRAGGVPRAEAQAAVRGAPAEKLGS
ncbi:MAG TPA: FUSC family protein [Thermoleophilaceae bacterium]|nr:FUSC family protein [Thermoleophilaceae bacterium]